jgi:hypothetical protein
LTSPEPAAVAVGRIWKSVLLCGSPTDDSQGLAFAQRRFSAAVLAVAGVAMYDDDTKQDGPQQFRAYFSRK